MGDAELAMLIVIPILMGFLAILAAQLSRLYAEHQECKKIADDMVDEMNLLADILATEKLAELEKAEPEKQAEPEEKAEEAINDRWDQI